MGAPRPKPSRLTIMIARWAVLLGIMGTAFAVVALTNDTASPAENGMFMLATILLSVAFVLAPLVRRAFGVQSLGRPPAQSSRRTLLDEMREVDAQDQAPAREEDSPRPMSLLTARLVVGLYVIFGCALVAALWAMQRG